MASKLITTHELTGVRVVGGKNGTKRIGKVRRFVFHPKEKRCVGFIVKRPDLLWMFRRKDKFVSIEGYDIVDGRIAIRNVPEATDRAACKALGVNWDDCVLWVGLPVMTEDGTSLGMVGNVTFNRITGMVDTFDTDSGATANALLGKRTIPADLVKGFRRGMGAALAQVGSEGRETDEVVLGAMLVDDAAKDLVAEGGVAEKAGAVTAVAVDKVHTTVDRAKPVVSEAAKKTGEVVNKGAYATGKQIAATKGMFSGVQGGVRQGARCQARFRRPGSGRDGRGGRRGRFRACEARVDRAQERRRPPRSPRPRRTCSRPSKRSTTRLAR